MNRQMINDAPPMYHAATQRAIDGVASPRGAIKAMCLHCMGYVRSAITDCSTRRCPLYRYRPYQAGTSDVDDIQSLAEATEQSSQD